MVIPVVAQCRPTQMQLWMLIQQLLLVVSKNKKPKDSLLNSFFTCLSAEPHVLLSFLFVIVVMSDKDGIRIEFLEMWEYKT